MARFICFGAILALVLLSHLSVSLAKFDVESVYGIPPLLKELYGLPPLLKEPKSGYFKALEDCGKRCLPHCATVFGNYLNGKGQSSVACCINLVNDIRYNCHFEIAKGIMLYKKFKHERVDIMNKALELWDDCSTIVKKYGPGTPPKMI